jgi:hypothetical protein
VKNAVPWRGDRGFESGFLHRRVRELSVPPETKSDQDAKPRHSIPRKQSLINPTPSHATFCLGGGAGAKLPLELGKGQQHVERQASHRARRIELLRHRDERQSLGVEEFDQPGKIGELRMKASQASRCAASELNSCSSPSSEDLRV